MAGWRWSIVLALGVCCFTLPSGCQPGEAVVATFSDESVNAWIAAASVSTNAEVASITKEELPKRRPWPGPKGYSFCTLSSCASRVRVRARNGAAPDNNLTHGVLSLELRYKPIRDVNSTMMTWLFENMAGNAVYAPTNKTFPMYLIFHPRDHVFHKVQKINGRVRKGATLTWCEMILSNCAYDKNNATEPWSCPKTARGFVQSNPEASWATKYKTKEDMVVNWFNSTGIEFSRVERNLLGPVPRVVATTRHTWADNSGGTALINMRTNLWIGLMVSGRTNRFETTDFAGTVNGIISSQIMSGTSDLGSQNATALGYMNALHFIEEYGGTKSWLPDVWKARKKASSQALPASNDEDGFRR